MHFKKNHIGLISVLHVAGRVRVRNSGCCVCVCVLLLLLALHAFVKPTMHRHEVFWNFWF